MADSEVTSKLKIIIEEHITKNEKSIKFLDKLNDRLKKTLDNLEKHNKGNEKLLAGLDKLAKSIDVVVRGLSGAIDGIRKMGRGFAKLGGFMAALVVSSLKVGDHFLKLQTYALDGSKAVDSLRIMIGKFGTTAVVNIGEAVDAIVAFKTQSLAATIAMQDNEGAMYNAMNVAKKMAGKHGLELLLKMSQKVSREDYSDFIAALGKAKTGSKEWIYEMQGLNSVVMESLMFGNLFDRHAKGMDKAAAGAKAWQEVTGQLSSEWQKFQDQLLDAIGTDLLQTIREFSTDLMPVAVDAISRFYQLIKDNKDVIVKSFRTLLDILGGIAEFLLKLPPSLQVLAGTLVIAPGIFTGFATLAVSVGTLVTNLSQIPRVAGWAARALRGMPGFGMRAAAGIGGHMAGTAIARKMGAEEGSVGEALAGLAGAAVTGDVIGAVVSGGISIGKAFLSWRDAVNEANAALAKSKQAIDDLDKKMETIIEKGKDEDATPWEKYKGKRESLQKMSRDQFAEVKRLEDLASGRTNDKVLAGSDEAKQLFQDREAAKKKYEQIQKMYTDHIRSNQKLIKDQRKLNEIEEERLRIENEITTTVGEFKSAVTGSITAIQAIRRETEFGAKNLEVMRDIIEAFGGGFGNFDVTRDSLDQYAKVLGELPKTQQEYNDRLKEYEALPDTTEGERKEKNIAMKELEELGRTVIGLINDRKSAIENVADEEKRAMKYESAIVSLQESRLNIQKSLFGGATLSVDAQMAVVNAIERQKQAAEAVVEKQMELVRAAQAKGVIDYEAQEAALAAQTEVNELTQKQLNMVKELRDGYLDAVTAQAFGAGRFEKILITQQKNIGKGLDENVLKKSYLLGGVGKEAARISKVPERFGAGGIGDMTGMGGQPLSPQARQESIENIPEHSRAITQSSQNLVTSQDRLVDAVNRNTDATASDYASKAARGTGLMGPRGGPAQGVMEGQTFQLYDQQDTRHRAVTRGTRPPFETNPRNYRVPPIVSAPPPPAPGGRVSNKQNRAIANSIGDVTSRGGGPAMQAAKRFANHAKGMVEAMVEIAEYADNIGNREETMSMSNTKQRTSLGSGSR